MLGGTVMLLALAAASALPQQEESRRRSRAEELGVDQPEEDTTYDQRQNGTENLRVQLSDVTLVVAPAEALLAVSPGDIFQGQLKPKLASGKPSRSKHKLAHFLMNVLQRNHH